MQDYSQIQVKTHQPPVKTSVCVHLVSENRTSQLTMDFSSSNCRVLNEAMQQQRANVLSMHAWLRKLDASRLFRTAFAAEQLGRSLWFSLSVSAGLLSVRWLKLNRLQFKLS